MLPTGNRSLTITSFLRTRKPLPPLGDSGGTLPRKSQQQPKQGMKLRNVKRSKLARRLSEPLLLALNRKALNAPRDVNRKLDFGPRTDCGYEKGEIGKIGWHQKVLRQEREERCNLDPYRIQNSPLNPDRNIKPPTLCDDEKSEDNPQPETTPDPEVEEMQIRVGCNFICLIMKSSKS